MDLLQVDLARELHRDRERLIAQGRYLPRRPAPAGLLPRAGLVLAALDRAAVLTGRRLRFAH
jgi:hypothetical protein